MRKCSPIFDMAGKLLSSGRASKRYALLFASITLSLAGCNSQKTVSETAAELRQHMSIEGCSISNPGPVQLNGSSQSVEWDIQCSAQAGELGTQLESRLSPDFKKVSQGSNFVVFSRFDGGDSTRLQVQFSGSSQAHVRLTVSPD